MDLFYETLPSKSKRRVHFHEFMLEVHRILHQLRKKGYSGSEMMQMCVEQLSEDCKILCFDEFQVTDIADAMIMKQLFSSLYSNGVLIIITSNREVDELYKNGIQRDLFIPFLEEIKENYQIVKMASSIDYRTANLDLNRSQFNTLSEATVPFSLPESTSSLYFLATNSGQAAEYKALWSQMSQDKFEEDSLLRVQGRNVRISMAGKDDDIARFDFIELCGLPLGAADYQTIAQCFHTVFLDNIPELTLFEINQIRRFIILVDTFNDQNTVLIASGKKRIEEILNLQVKKVC